MPFQVGNRLGLGATPWGEKKPFLAALARALKQYNTGDVPQGQALRAIADKLVEIALTGEQWAVKEIIDRVDGKAHQTLAVETKNVREYSRAELAQYISGEIIDAEEIPELADETSSESRTETIAVANRITP